MFGFNSKKSLLQSGILNGSVDNHSHVLFGVDDGVKDLKTSLKILGYMAQAGVETLWLTPHIMEDVPNTTDALRDRFEELKAAYDGPVKLCLAAEYMLDSLYRQRLSAGDLLPHGEGYVLVETSVWSGPLDFWDLLEDTMSAGYRPILAHPERYLYMSSADYTRLKDMGVLLQCNIPSLAGAYGEAVRDRALKLLSESYFSMLGSDCHRFTSIEKQYNAPCLGKSALKALETIKRGI